MSAVKELNEALNHFHLGADARYRGDVVSACGHGVSYQQVCPQCHIEISEYLSTWDGNRPSGSETAKPGQSAFATQEGGDHYSKLRIQPMEYSMANQLDACQHTIIKYVTRFRDKGGIQDLRKAIHVLEMLIEIEGCGSNAGG